MSHFCRFKLPHFVTTGWLSSLLYVTALPVPASQNEPAADTGHVGATPPRVLDSNEQIVQSYSEKIKALLALRPAYARAGSTEQMWQEDIDARIAALREERDSAYRDLVLRRRPQIAAAAPGSRFYRVPVDDLNGNRHWFVGEVPAVWHLERLDTEVFSIADSILLHPDNLNLPEGAAISHHLLIGGTGAQSMVHPYPGDYDYSELFSVRAGSAAEAGAVIADVIAEFVNRNQQHSRFEFTRLRVMPLRRLRSGATNYVWNSERILDPLQRAELARQITTLDGGRINTDWRALVSNDRFIIIGKILSIDARDAESDAPFFQTEPLRVSHQGAYFGRDLPDTPPQVPLGAFAQHMRKRALVQLDSGHYLKAAKRSFNFCRAVGDLHCIDHVTPVFNTSAARVYHSYKVIEAIAETLDPDTPSRILTANNARAQLEDIADEVEANLPVVPGTLPERPALIARQLRVIAGELTATDGGLLQTDEALAKRLRVLSELELIAMVELSLQERVTRIVDTYVR